MAETSDVLQCPMLCGFSVDSQGGEILQLHFEHVHTTDSPFVTDSDCGHELLPPRRMPSSPSTPTAAAHVVAQDHDQDTPASDDEDDHDAVLCPEPECGELVLLSDYNDHLDYHAAETLSFDASSGTYHSKHPFSSADMNSAKGSPTRIPAPRRHASPGSANQHSFHGQNPDAATTPHHQGAARNEEARKRLRKKSQRGRSDTSGSEKSTLSRSILSFNPFARSDRKVKPPASTCRLGRAELGPYAWEDRMPKWLHDQLAAGPKITMVNRIGRDGRLIKQEQVQNETPGIIPILAQLSALDRSVKEAYYCHPSTLHVGKTPKEGGFCGYRNIQMLVSYIQGAKAQGQDEFPGRTPGILKLQDMIERAWDQGINDIGRQQTGGIRDTRKYIGTPEAQALFLSCQIDCAVEMFTDSPDGSIEAHEQLLAAIERYFSQATVSDGSGVYKTLLPPVYLQQPGHSTTIVGFERRRDGACNLVIFDPMYSTSPAMHKLIGRKSIRTHRPEVLHAHRRGSKQLRKHAAFEILMLTAHPPLFPAWDVLRQFPDCRFLYVFFRSRTLGYDIYPEDHFLRTFPWQQYGSLWVVDDARFARSENLNLATAKALRQITQQGALAPQDGNDAIKLNCSSFPYPRCPPGQGPNVALDGAMSGYASSPEQLDFTSVLHTTGMHDSRQDLQNTSRLLQTKLSLLTDVGRRYPGYPSPLSPTIDAKHHFPSPASQAGSGVAAPQKSTNAPYTAHPRNLNALDMGVKTQYHAPYSYDGVISPLDLPQLFGSFGKMLTTGVTHCSWNGFSPVNATHIITPPASPKSQSPGSPGSPSPLLSPRTTMIQNLLDKQRQSFSFQPLAYASTPPHHSEFSPYWTPSLTPPPPSLSLPLSTGGVESAITSPLSPSGTMLSYTSNRSVGSGLLGVRALTEAQVAEYRFWRHCGRRSCAFGCGEGGKGEKRAARRLFRSVDEVEVDVDGSDEGGVGMRGGNGGKVQMVVEEKKMKEIKRESQREKRMKVHMGLLGRERDGVADE